MSEGWKPKAWIAIVLGVFLQSVTFLYVNKAKLFWLYFALSSAAYAADWFLGSYFSLVFSIVCPLHAVLISRRYDSAQVRKWYSRWWGIPLAYLLIVSPFVFVRAFMYEPFSIPATSMEPTVKAGDHIVVEKLGYGTYGTYGITLFSESVAPEKMQPGNIYVFKDPTGKAMLVKRLIAGPGDEVYFDAEGISVNGAPLAVTMTFEGEQKKIVRETLNDISFHTQRFMLRRVNKTGYIKVPENHYFFVGDNRDNSSDSRFWGTVPGENIIGKVAFIIH